jgi:hypothetical protein
MMGLVFTSWHIIFWHPLNMKKDFIENQIKTITYDIQQLTLQINQTSAILKLKKVENKSFDELIANNKLPNILRKLIGIRQNLKLTDILVTPQKTITVTVPNYGVKLYTLNGVTVKLYGPYFSLLSYLKEMEVKKLPVFWDSLNYVVTDYPYASITLELHAFSY